MKIEEYEKLNRLLDKFAAITDSKDVIFAVNTIQDEILDRLEIEDEAISDRFVAMFG